VRLHLLHGPGDLTRRNGEEPDQQAEQNQRTENREKTMQRVELEVWIASETISCRQHRTSFCTAQGGGNGRPVSY
jgi:hypothetical protein